MKKFKYEIRYSDFIDVIHTENPKTFFELFKIWLRERNSDIYYIEIEKVGEK